MYKKLYFKLFAAVADALEEMERANYGSAAQLLLQAQRECEDLYAGGG